MKKNNIYKGFLPYQSEFSHMFACWANNHRGWAKMKKSTKDWQRSVLGGQKMANEERLIDANAIPYEKRTECFGHGEFFEVQKVYKEQIDKMPTVDAVEVVHGHWDIFDDGYGCEIMCCSVCKADFYDGDNDTVDHTHNYCPNCGAKMDGDGDEK